MQDLNNTNKIRAPNTRGPSKISFLSRENDSWVFSKGLKIESLSAYSMPMGRYLVVLLPFICRMLVPVRASLMDS